MIRVFLVEDQTLVREGIRSLLGLLDDIEVVGEAADGEEALEQVPRLAPDVLLLDIRLPGRSGLEVLAELGKTGGAPPTLLLTTFDDSGAFLEGMRLGAQGYLLKDVTLERLAEAIRRLAAGGNLIQPAVTDYVARHLPGLPAGGAADFELPTEREKAILRFLAGGYSNREIAAALGIAEGTVKNHVSNLLPKLQVRDRTQAVLKAIALGLI